MPPDQIQNLAQEIVSQSIQSSWGYWLLVVALLFVATFAGSYLSKYAAKRAERKADEADLKAILKNVEQTTRLTEDIKSVVSLDEWSERERRTLKRTKLEELVFKAYSVYDWLGTARLKLLSLEGGGFEPDWWPLDTVTTLGTLYFPELQEPVGIFAEACKRYYGTIYSVHADLLTAALDQDADDRIKARLEAKYKRSPELDEVGTGVKESLQALCHRAAAVMKDLIEVSRPTPTSS